MGLLILILGLIVFFGAHTFVTFREARAAAIERLGLTGYRALFALVSLAGLALIVWGFGQYRAHDWIQVWSPPAFMRHITVGLMLFAVILFTAAFIPSHIKAKAKHPMLAGVKTWALAHLLSNGDLGSILLFGSFLAWGVYARIAAKRRGDVGRRPRRRAGPTTSSWSCSASSFISRSATPSIRSSSACRCSGMIPKSLFVQVMRKTRNQAGRDQPLPPDIRARKGGEPIVCLTSYHAHTARIVDKHCDVILVGDSLGMVMHGLETTVPVTLDMMILQGHAVMRGSKRALVVVDMPFGSYEASKEQAFMNAARVLKETGCGAIKVEGGTRMAETIRFLVERGVPVMAHVGLTPQAINVIGSFRAQGREEADWARIEDDALAVAEAGAFSVVIEAVAEPLARKLTAAVQIPTIGIGASVACDGQILVLEDMLGLSPRVPKFVKRYTDLGPGIDKAIADYAAEVRARTFPGPRARLCDEGQKALNP